MLTPFLFVALVLATHAEEEQSDVVVLTDANFDDTITQHEAVFVEFYAPWCGHCKKLTPEYEKFATAMKGTDAVVAKVDATVEKKSAGKYGVRGYPTLKMFSMGSPADYKGGRTADAMEAFLRKQLGPAVATLNNKAEFDEFVPSKAGSMGKIVGFYKDDSTAVGAFYSQYARSKRNDYSFGGVHAAELVAEVGQKDETIVMFKGDDEAVVFDGSLDKTAFDEFIKNTWFPLVGEINSDNHAAYNGRGKTLLYLFSDPAEAEKHANTIAVYEAAAKKFKDYSFGWLNGPAQIKTAGKLGFQGKDFPMLATQIDGANYLFPEGDPFTNEAVQKWVQDLIDGNIHPFVKSEKIPEDPLDKDGVRIIVGDNFKSVVQDDTKDVLVEFYAPWCGHCKKLVPVYAEVAQKFKGIDSVIIAKMDATANDMPRKEFPVKGFPTIKLCQSIGNKVIAYNGDRTAPSLIKFVQENAKTRFELPSEESAGDDAGAGKKDEKQDEKDEL